MSGYLDLASWKHRRHYDFFRSFAMPFFNVCVEIDVTSIWRRSHEEGGPSFFLAALYAAARAANEVEAFHLRLRDDGVWRHDSLSMDTTVMREDESYTFVHLPDADSYREFEREALHRLKRARNEEVFVEAPADDATIYHSSLPWLRFTAFSNALPLRGDSVPRLMFGKSTQVGDRVMMPVGIEVHHAVVQGLDVSRFVDAFQAHAAVR
jgi:chloramphenicol O-acetyltransferase type A